MHGLNKEEQCIAVNLAMGIECGTVNVDDVARIFQNDPVKAGQIAMFWYYFNDMTRNAFNLVSTQQYRNHLEKCLSIECKQFPDLEQ